MKLLTWNILAGGRKRLPLILGTIKKEQPDFVALQEANGFERDHGTVLKNVAGKLGLPYFDLSPSAKYDFHVASFSRYPFLSVKKIPLAKNSCLFTAIHTKLGEIAIINAHPCPTLEVDRLNEINTILSLVPKDSPTIIMGDMNSLSTHDVYPHNIAEKFSEKHRAKFTLNGVLATKVTNRIERAGFMDTAFHLGKNAVNTAPTGVDLKELYAIQYDAPQVRIDYVFVTKDLVKRVSDYKVIRNKTTERASDHFPLILTLKG